MKKELDLRHISSWEDMKKEVNDHYNKKVMKEHDWVVGRGLDDSKFDDIDHLLTAKDLEELEHKRPMFFLHEDGHECVLNEEAMNIVKKKDDMEKNHAPFIEKDDDGNWTGRFKDTAVHFIKFHFRGKTEEEIYEAVKDAVPHLLEKGLTSVHTDDLNFVGDYHRLWNTYLDLEKNGDLKIKVFLHHYTFNIDDLKRFLKTFDKRTGEGTDHVKVGSIKLFLDGTQRLHTSALRKPYLDKPETSGNLIYSEEDLYEIVKLADDNNMQVAMHSIGDRTVEEALNVLEKVGVKKMRHRIIHAQVLAEDLLDRLEKLKPYLEIQPGFLMGEYDQTADWVGKEQEKYCNAWQSVNQRKIPYTGSSDAPIGPLSPMVQVFAAVNRTDLNHQPEGGWLPEQKLTVDQIYHSYTATPAELEFQESEKGKLELGYVGDLLLLEEHPNMVDTKDLKDIQVKSVWIDGEKVY
jgi:predicted amidohydrolase YtcJ